MTMKPCMTTFVPFEWAEIDAYNLDLAALLARDGEKASGSAQRKSPPRRKGQSADTVEALAPWPLCGIPETLATNPGGPFTSSALPSAGADPGRPHMSPTVERWFAALHQRLPVRWAHDGGAGPGQRMPRQSGDA